jgi:hypothetical protein
MKLKDYIREATYREENDIAELSEKLLDLLEKKEKEYSGSYQRLQYKDYTDEHDRFSRDFYKGAIRYILDVKEPLKRLADIYKEAVRQTKSGKRLTD